MRFTTIKIRTAPGGRTHLSVDGRTPVCRTTHSYPFSRAKRSEVVTCRVCRDHLRTHIRRLESMLAKPRGRQGSSRV